MYLLESENKIVRLIDQKVSLLRNELAKEVQ
jgi:hypothetical protein